MRDFDEWLSKFRASISSYDYYIDFEKVVKNVEEIKVELNILNTLIGSKNIEEDFEKIMTKYPETLQCIPLLLAVRGYEIYAQDEDGAFLYNFKKMNYSVEQYKIFMRKTGLFDMIANHLVNKDIDVELMKSELQQSLPTYEITVRGRNVRFYSAVEEFDAEYPLSFLMELYKLDMLYDLFILPALVPN